MRILVPLSTTGVAVIRPRPGRAVDVGAGDPDLHHVLRRA
jgi:hypothetical protein